MRRLCDALRAEQIAYCHWKSNASLDRSASGDSDLDLLVGWADARRFSELIRRLGFREGRQPRRQQSPGVYHAYGFDEASGKLVHLHAHHQLVLGDDMTKNYRLPLEEAYLRSAEQGPLFRIPAPEFEFVVFVLRMVLKHSTADALLTTHGSLSEGEELELAYLRGRADPERARAVIDRHLPFIGTELWDRCVACLEPGASFASRVLTAHGLERSLASQARRSPALDPFVRVWRRSRRSFDRRVRHRRGPRSRLGTGGALIALVGGDGAGKSTAVDEVHRWLSRDLDATRVHLGKPPRSVLSSLVQGLWRGGARSVAGGTSGSDRSPVILSDDEPMTPRRFVKLIRKVLVSRDRYLAYRRARRLASNGTVVICDRFPLAEVGLMDGPATRAIPRSRERSLLIRSLARLEERYYSRITYPDILIVLRVDPEVAVRRRHGTEDEAFVRRRSEEIWRMRWDKIPAVVIDAGRPKDEVLAAVKSAIWVGL